ncbi:MAG: hypothetical protein AAF224_14960 [Pseudomonadota bacterium]
MINERHIGVPQKAAAAILVSALLFVGVSAVQSIAMPILDKKRALDARAERIAMLETRLQESAMTMSEIYPDGEMIDASTVLNEENARYVINAQLEAIIDIAANADVAVKNTPVLAQPSTTSGLIVLSSHVTFSGSPRALLKTIRTTNDTRVTTSKLTIENAEPSRPGSARASLAISRLAVSESEALSDDTAE